MKIETIVDKVFLNKEEKKFIKSNKAKNIKGPSDGNHIILEINNDYFALIHNTYLINDKKFKDKKFIGLWTPCMQREKGLLNFFKFIIKYTVLTIEKNKWIKIYKSIGVQDVICINDDFKTNFFNYKNSFVKRNLEIKNKKEYLNLKFKDILVGELMYDFYLRYYKKFQLNFKDKYEIIKISNFVQCFYKNLNSIILKFNKKKIDRYIPWQTCYIQCGIPVRFFLKNGIKTIGKSQEVFSKKYTIKDSFQTLFFEDLRKDFLKLKYKKKNINKGFKSLKLKYQGKINSEINYLQFSSYNNKNFSNIKKNIDIVIFLPDFVDSPHSFGGKFVFSDFYDWIIATIKFLENYKNLNIAIKPHPNARYASKIGEEILKKNFSSNIWLDRNISNHSIFKKKPLFSISPRGSVLFDLAYHGIPSIAFGRNPCMAYPFTFTAMIKKQYFNFIKQGINKNLKLPKNYKDLVAECYFMNYLNKNEYFETISSKVKLKNYRSASTTTNISILKKYNEGFFNKLI